MIGPRTVLLLLLLALPMAAAGACGGRNGTDGSEASPTPAMPFGPTPALGGHVVQVVPAHGGSIAQAATRTLDERTPQPPCFAADFTGLPQQAQWFRVLVDGVEITPRLTWVVSSNPASTTPPRACFATADGLTVGRHTVTVIVRDPFTPGAPNREVVTWSFDVLR